MDALQITTKNMTGSALVTVSGELDIATKPELIDYVSPILNTHVCMVILDLGGITFIDAQGLSTLLMIERQARLIPTGLLLAGVPPVVLSLLRITHLDKHFRVFPRVEAADCIRLVDHVESTAGQIRKQSLAGQSRG
jgi:anti-sigma B factor antagonist